MNQKFGQLLYNKQSFWLIELKFDQINQILFEYGETTQK